MPSSQANLREEVSLAALRKDARNRPMIDEASSSSLNAKNLARLHNLPSSSPQSVKQDNSNARRPPPPTSAASMQVLQSNTELNPRTQRSYPDGSASSQKAGSMLVSNSSSVNTLSADQFMAARHERATYGYKDLLTTDNQPWQPVTGAVHGDRSVHHLSMFGAHTLVQAESKVDRLTLAGPGHVAAKPPAEAKRMGKIPHAKLLVKFQPEKIAMKRTIAEDCSGERQHKKRLLYCLSDRSISSEGRKTSKNVDRHALAAMMGLTSQLQKTVVEPVGRTYGCKNCQAMLAKHDDIISRNFRGQHGKAYLFGTVQNITKHEAQERNMTTGRHVLRDVSCRKCKEIVGWAYDKAYEASEKYKEGKTVLECELLCDLSKMPSRVEEQKLKEMLLTSSKASNNQTENREASLADRVQDTAVGSRASVENAYSEDLEAKRPDPAKVDDSEVTEADIMSGWPTQPPTIGPRIIEYVNGLKHLDDQKILQLLQAARNENPL